MMSLLAPTESGRKEKMSVRIASELDRRERKKLGTSYIFIISVIYLQTREEEEEKYLTFSFITIWKSRSGRWHERHRYYEWEIPPLFKKKEEVFDQAF